MKLVRSSLTTVLTLSFLTACGQVAHNSSIKGHPEHIDDPFTAQTSKDGILVSPTAVPEYRDSKAVIISLEVLTSTHQHAMAKALLDSGIELLYVMVPRVYGYKTADQSPDFLPLKALGAELSRIVLVPVKDSAATAEESASGEKVLTVWARDWSPQPAYAANGQLVLLDFNYYSNREADDSAGRSLVEFFNQEVSKSIALSSPKVVSRISVPVYNEGGNFMNNDDGACLMTSRVTDANSAATIAEAAQDNRRKKIRNDEAMDQAEIIRQYKEKTGCKTVSIFPRMPYEGTGHIDMWAKFLDNKTVIVSELRDEIVNLSSYSAEEKTKAQEIQSYLEARASDIAKLGFEVLRIPMPAPIFGYTQFIDAKKKTYRQVPQIFRSYTNSITVNSHAVTPRYEAMDVEAEIYDAKTNRFLSTKPLTDAYPDAAWNQAYENEAKNAYEKLGYTMNFVRVDNLIAIGGAIHCTTMQIAKKPNVL